MGTLEKHALSACIQEVDSCYCGAKVRPFLAGPFVVFPDGRTPETLATTVYYCDQCNLLIRGLDYSHPLVASRWEMTGRVRTSPEEQRANRRLRQRGFEWLVKLVREHLGRQPAIVVDFGCDTGHLLDLFRAAGTPRTIGIEIAPATVEQLKRDGRHQVYTSFFDADIANDSVDVITDSDTLYYYPKDLLELFGAVREKLRPGGLLVIRTANRNLLCRLWSWWWRLVHGRRHEAASMGYFLLNDWRFGLSEKALRLLLERAGLKTIACYRWEHKTRPMLQTLFEMGAVGLYYLSAKTIDFCPGLVLVARK